MLTETDHISLSQGLNGQDLNIDIVLKLWNELQTSSVDAAQAPMSNLFTFAESAVFLAVIMLKQKPNAKGNGARAKQPQSTPAHTTAPYPFVAETYERMYSFESPPTSRNTKPYDIGQDPPTGEEVADRQAAEWDSANQHAAYSSDPVWQTITNDAELDHHGHSGLGYDWEIAQAASDLQGQTPIGLLYLTSTPHHDAPAGDLNIGIVLDAASRGRGYARQALELVLAWVFDDVKFHRVQAAVLDSREKPSALTLFTKMGFGHEGTRRRSVFSPAEGMWKDATYLAMLDTEWFMRSFYTPAPKSLWDEMFTRHHREREELLRWDKSRSGLPRSSSTETLRDAALTPDAGPSSQIKLEADADDAAPDVVPSPTDKVKRKRDEAPEPWDDGAASPPPPSESSYASASEESDFGSPGPSRIRRTSAASNVSSARRSAVDPFRDDARSSSPESSVSSVGSRWDMVETSSTSSSSNFESLGDSDIEI